MSISRWIKDSLSAAHYENGYPHEIDRPSQEYVDEIYESSGIEGFDPENPEHQKEANGAVQLWRSLHIIRKGS